MPTEAWVNPWEESASCKETPNHDIFFPLRENDTDIPRAKAVCASCPVRQECLEQGLVARVGYDYVQGIWGGTTEQERARIRTWLRHGQTLGRAINS